MSEDKCNSNNTKIGTKKDEIKEIEEEDEEAGEKDIQFKLNISSDDDKNQANHLQNQNHKY